MARSLVLCVSVQLFLAALLLLARADDERDVVKRSQAVGDRAAKRALRYLSPEALVEKSAGQLEDERDPECPWPPALCPDGGMHGGKRRVRATMEETLQTQD